MWLETFVNAKENRFPSHTHTHLYVNMNSVRLRICLSEKIEHQLSMIYFSNKFKICEPKTEILLDAG